MAMHRKECSILEVAYVAGARETEEIQEEGKYVASLPIHTLLHKTESSEALRRAFQMDHLETVPASPSAYLEKLFLPVHPSCPICLFALPSPAWHKDDGTEDLIYLSYLYPAPSVRLALDYFHTSSVHLLL